MKVLDARTLAGTLLVPIVVATMWGCGSSGGAAAGGDGTSSGSCPAPDPVPPQSLSPGTARFVITNHTNATRWVAREGQPCDPFTIDGVALHPTFVCGCECPREMGGSLTFTRLAPGESTTITWDERRTVMYTSEWTPNLCPTDECSPTPSSVEQAVASGTYTVTFLVADDATLQALGGNIGVADAGDAGDADAADAAESDGGSSASVPENIDRSRADGLCLFVPTLPKVFEVPATFDVEVDVSIDS